MKHDQSFDVIVNVRTSQFKKLTEAAMRKLIKASLEQIGEVKIGDVIEREFPRKRVSK
jgi:hypothetical protein